MYAKATLVLRSSLIIMALSGLLGCKKNPESELLDSLTKEEWLISGRIIDRDFDKGEVVALSTAGDRYQSSIQAGNSFALNLPGNDTFAIYFLPSPGINTDNISPALLTFDSDSEIGMRDTLRLPKTTATGGLDLGILDIKGDYAYPGTNPATKLDFDEDGIPDSQDHDDENDGLPDASQNSDGERITICHEQQKTMAVSLTELLSHLNHLDLIGDCERTAEKNKKAPSIDAMALKSSDPSPNRLIRNYEQLE